MRFTIEVMQESDWHSVKQIYLEGINTKIATFQSELPSWEEWDKGHCKNCRLVAKAEDVVLGWAALSPVSSRCVYAGVAEVSVYIGGQYQGKGVGKALLMNLVERSEKNGYWTLQSGIIKENAASLKLHLTCGFREVGFRERLGKMDNGRWHDVVLVERRSSLVG